MSALRIRAGGELRHVGAACGAKGCLCLNRACWEAAVAVGGLEQQVCSARTHLAVREVCVSISSSLGSGPGPARSTVHPARHADEPQAPN